MNKSALYDGLVALGVKDASLRPHIRPLLKAAGCEKLPEGPMRDNCENKKDEGSEKEAGKQARTGDTYGRRQGEIRSAFWNEVMAEAAEILKMEGASNLKIGRNGMVGMYQGKPFDVQFSWKGLYDAEMTAVVSYAGKSSSKGFVVLSLSPMNVASEALYAHFHNGGFLV